MLGKLFNLKQLIIIFFLLLTHINPVLAQSALATNFLGPTTIADMVEKVGPAVVNIDVVRMQKTQVFNPFKDFQGQFGFQMDPEFKHMFEDRIVPIKGAGSGFIINKQGHIITNNHVVESADKLKVTLKDGRSFDATIIGKDRTLDIAIIQIQAPDLPTVILGDSNKIRPGEWVVAIGNPYQFANSVTAGIISATERELTDLGKKHLIQTDAAINPGNSGGPLLNLNGEVIGINVAIAAGAEGIGFAIPINEAKEVLSDLIQNGKISRPWLGIYMRDVNEQIANYLGLPLAEGVIITETVKGSPAEKIGLQKMDIIKKIDQDEIKTSSEVSEKIKSKKPNDQIIIEIYRKGKRLTLTGKIGEAP